MASRSIQFFMRIYEFESLIWEVADQFKLSVIMVRLYKNYKLEIAEQLRILIMSDGLTPDWIFLAAEPPQFNLHNITRTFKLLPGKLGWVKIDVPKEEGKILFLAGVSAKSDWYESKNDQISENPVSIKLFSKIVSHIRKKLHRPVWAYNIRVKGSEPQPYRNIGYSSGTKDWVKQGGELMQWGVHNVRFSLKGYT